MKKVSPYMYAVFGLGTSAFLGGAFLWIPTNVTEFIRPVPVEGVIEVPEVQKVAHQSVPENVKAIYMTACAAATPSFRNRLISLIDETELNSVVIDVKDFSGTLSFISENPLLVQENVSGCRVPDMGEMLQVLHEKGVYVIARVTVFQDPHYAELHPDIAVQKESDKSIWRDYKGLAFIDVGAQKYWEYIVEVSKESYALGFDEINFDYIRYPSDGDMKDIYYPVSEDRVVGNPEYGKALVLRDFFAYLQQELKPIGVKMSADLFGMTTTNTDDLNIGQIQEYATPYFDFIAPMTYPSHYPSGFFGIENPNTEVYKVLNISIAHAVERLNATSTVVFIPGADTIASSTPLLYTKKARSANKLRPWIQDFNYGGTYGKEEVLAQIAGARDAGATSWMLWSPSNRYTRGALGEGE